MSEISDAIQAKCLAFSDRIIKLNDYLLKEAANAKPTYKIVKGILHPSAFVHLIQDNRNREFGTAGYVNIHYIDAFLRQRKRNRETARDKDAFAECGSVYGADRQATHR